MGMVGCRTVIGADEFAGFAESDGGVENVEDGLEDDFFGNLWRCNWSYG
jgi:hypothetical protein